MISISISTIITFTLYFYRVANILIKHFRVMLIEFWELLQKTSIFNEVTLDSALAMRKLS